MKSGGLLNIGVFGIFRLHRNRFCHLCHGTESKSFAAVAGPEHRYLSVQVTRSGGAKNPIQKRKCKTCTTHAQRKS